MKIESNKQMKNNKLPYHQKPGFKIPENYFENFEEKMMRNVSRDSVLENKGETGFTVPTGYFDAVENNIFKKIEPAQEKGKLISLFTTSKWYYAAAVAAVFIAMVTTIYTNPVSQEFSLSSLELSTLENYIDEGYIDLNFNQLTTFLTEEGYTYDNIYTSGLSEDEVFEYINDNIADHDLFFE